MVDFSQFSYAENSNCDHEYDYKIDFLAGSSYARNKKNSESFKNELKEIYHSPDMEEQTLRLIIVGHNPSGTSWERGHYYANPVNRMWKLLILSGLTPKEFTCLNDVDCPRVCGVGFTDLMLSSPETKSSSIKISDSKAFKLSFYQRIVDHVHRIVAIRKVQASEACPKVIAFAGIRQWKALFPSDYNFDVVSNSKQKKDYFSDHAVGVKRKLRAENSIISNPSQDFVSPKKSPYGVQTDRPPDWPAVLANSVIFVLPSSSGAAALVILFHCSSCFFFFLIICFTLDKCRKRGTLY